MIPTQIKRDKRSFKYYPHRVPPHIQAKSAKLTALRDITTECGKDKMYKQCYIRHESEILQFIRNETINLISL